MVGVDRRPGRVALLALLASSALGFYALRNLGVDADPEAMIAPDLPFLALEHEFKRRFRNFDQAIFLVVDGPTPFAASRTASALAERLAPRSDLFSQLDLPDGGPFFERNALLYLELDRLEELADRLAQAQPVLGELARDPSAVGVARLLEQGLDAQRDGVDLGIDLAPAVDRVRAAIDAATEGRTTPDPWGDTLAGGPLAEEGRHRLVVLKPRLDDADLLGAGPALDAIRAAIGDLALEPASGVRVRVTGEPVLNYDEQLTVARQGRLVAVASLVLFLVVSAFGLRSIRVIGALAGSIVASLVWTNAFAALAVGHLNQISAAFNVLVVGLGGEFGIHVSMHYLELVGRGRSRREALAETGASVGGSLVSSAGTTSIGFLVFVPTDYRGVAELGLIASGGIALSLLSSLTVLPALLGVGAPQHPTLRAGEPPRWARRLEHLPLRFARPIRWAAALAALGALFLLPRARFDPNPVKLRDPNVESVQAFEDLIVRGRASPWTADVVAPSLAEAEALAERLRGLAVVERTRTLADYVPSDQEEKREVLDLMSLFVPEVTSPSAPPTREAVRAALAGLAASLEESPPADARLAASEAALREAIARFLAGPLDDAQLTLLERNAVGSLPEQIRDLRRALAPDEVGADDLPPTLRERMLSPEGMARIEVHPREDVRDGPALRRFVVAVQAVAPDATGLAVEIVEWARVAVSALQHALLGAFALGALFLFLLWRNPWDTLLAFFPLALAALFICALLVLFDQPFNFANVIVLPMLLGMGIDSGVHLVHQHRASPQDEDVLATSTARAVFYSAATTVAAFGSLAFAPHRGMATIGQLLTLGVAVTLLCYVVVLPAVLEWDDRRRARRSS
jgi:hypothetical protein